MSAATRFDHLLLENDERVAQYLTFMLTDEEYGIDIMKVREVCKWSGVTMIPNTPNYVLGMVNLHGMIVPIIDLRRRFDLQKASTDTSVVVVVTIAHESGERVVGLTVDAVSEVYSISEEVIDVAPDLGSVISKNYIRGFANVDGKMIIVLDIDLLINIGVLQDAVEKGMAEEEKR